MLVPQARPMPTPVAKAPQKKEKKKKSSIALAVPRAWPWQSAVVIRPLYHFSRRQDSRAVGPAERFGTHSGACPTTSPSGRARTMPAHHMPVISCASRKKNKKKPM